MLRGLFNIAATLSLLIALAVAATWLLTLHASQIFEFTYRNTTWRLTIEPGRLLLDNEPQRRLETEASCRQLREKARNTLATLQVAREHAVRRQALRVAALSPHERLYTAGGRTRSVDESMLERHLVLTRRQLHNPPPPSTRFTQDSISFTPLLAATALLPTLLFSAFAISRLRRRSLRKQNRCPHCSYDLRATPSLCPECGRASEATRASRMLGGHPHAG